jgi:hypothetical protein
LLHWLGLGWLALFGTAWVAFWFLLALAGSESNSQLPFWYLLVVIAGPLGVAAIAYRVRRRWGSRADSTFVALAVFAAAFLIPPVAFIVAVTLS